MRSGDFLLLFKSCGMALLCHALLVPSGVLVSEGNGAFQWRWFKGVGGGALGVFDNYDWIWFMRPQQSFGNGKGIVGKGGTHS